MSNQGWFEDIFNHENEKEHKEKFKRIGTEVFGFFQDIAPEYGYQDREGQWSMSCEIADSMKSKKHIVAEAGVGIGKSFAYIVPILYYHKLYKKPVVIATSTIALQEQLASDIKIVEDYSSLLSRYYYC